MKHKIGGGCPGGDKGNCHIMRENSPYPNVKNTSSRRALCKQESGQSVEKSLYLQKGETLRQKHRHKSLHAGERGQAEGVCQGVI